MRMTSIPPDHGRSWWLREALALPEFAGEPCPPLAADTKADVVVLGGGYTGNGVGPSHLGGRICAALATRADDGFTRLAVVTREPKRFPPEPVRSPGMLAVNTAIRRKDDREAVGQMPDVATRIVATLPRRLGFNLGPRP